jgi:hypothetical protein
MDWLVVDLPDLKNDGVRQLGLLFPMEKKSSKPPTSKVSMVTAWLQSP